MFGWEDPDLFYSRRIGRSPQGRPSTPGFFDMPDWTTILGAAKVTGKVGRDFNLGVISAATAREYADIDLGGARSTAEVEPFSHYGVARGLKEFGEGRSGLGFIATSVLRDLRPGALEDSISRDALALGVDGWTFLDKDRGWALAGWGGLTTVHGSREAMTALQLSPLHYFQRPDADWVAVDENATSLSGWAGRLYVNKQKGNIVFNAAVGAMSPGFEANDLGYHNRGDIINGHVEAGYRELQPGRLFRSWSVTGSYYRNYDFGWNRVGEYVYLDGKGKLLNYWTAGIHLDWEPPKYSHYLTRGGPMAFYPAGETIRLMLEGDDRKPFVLDASVQYRYHPSGGYNYTFAAGLAWKPSPNFRLSVGPSYTWRYSEGQWVRSVVDPLKTSTYGVRYVLSDIHPDDPAYRDPDQLDLHPAAEPPGLSPAVPRCRGFFGVQGAPRRPDVRFRLLRQRRLDDRLCRRHLHRRPRRGGRSRGAVHVRQPGLQPEVAPRNGGFALGVPARVDALFRLDAEAGGLFRSRRLRALAGPG